MNRITGSRAFVAVIVAIALLTATPPAQAQASNDDFATAVFYGKKFADLGEYAAAFEQYAKADAVRPDQAPVLYNMAVVLARAGRYSEAQVKVDRYLQLHPAGAERELVERLQLDLGFQRELQRTRQAMQEYAELVNRGRFSYGRGELADALRHFRQAEELRPSDPVPIYNQAVVLEKQGELATAIDRFRRYAELETDADRKAAADERIFALQREAEDMKSKIVCPFCGHKLPIGTTWCHRCWHGPYAVKSAVWNSRPCIEGATATRATYFADTRIAKNEDLACLFREGTMLESLRYTPSRQRAIQEIRRAEGWTYNGAVIQGWKNKDGEEIRYTQGTDYLEKITSSTGGEILAYTAHPGADGIWLLDNEDVVIDGQRYANHYEYDGAARISRQTAQYQNLAACHHLITVTADYTYDRDALLAVTVKGGYEGFVAEGMPKMDWQAAVGYSYDDKARVVKEELAVTSFVKSYAQKAHGALRDDINRIYPSMRIKKPIETAQKLGDLCATSGMSLLSNPIDLRPLYGFSPNLAIALQNGVARAVVTFTYPESYRP